MIFQCWAFRRLIKNLRKMVVKTVSYIKSILRRLWGGFGDGFGEDFGGLGRSWEGKMETGREKKCNKKGKTKKEANKRQKRGQDGTAQLASADTAEAGKEGFRAVCLVRQELSSTPSPS